MECASCGVELESGWDDELCPDCQADDDSSKGEDSDESEDWDEGEDDDEDGE